MSEVEHRKDEDLLTEHLAGRPGVFETLAARYAEDLFNFFRRFVGNAAAADDLVQETFLQVHLSAGSFDPKRTFKPWLYTIAANKGRDFMRARGRRPTRSLDKIGNDPDAPSPASLLEADGSLPADGFADQERRKLVREMITRMSETSRLVLILGYFQKLPYAEIADILEIPVGTVKSRLHAAVKQFAKLWLEATGETGAEQHAEGEA